MQNDYRESHKKPGKGASYDRSFNELPYRKVLWEREKAFLLQIVKQFSIGRDITHLDFACGTGRIVSFLADHVSTSSGVDLSDSMLETARKQAPKTELIKADITQNDALSNRTFNLITAFRFFPNAQPELRTEAMTALVKHLADDGIIVFNNHRNISSTFFRLARLTGRGYDIGMSQDEVQNLVSAAGMEITKIYHVGILPISDLHKFLPYFILNAIERTASAIPIFRSLSQNLVFVCRRSTNIK